MVALTVVAFAFVGLLGLHGRNVKLAADSQEITHATLLARELIAEAQFRVTTEGLDAVGNDRGTHPDYPGFRWEREVLPTEIDELRQIIVRVIFDEGRPNACEITYFVRDPAV